MNMATPSGSMAGPTYSRRPRLSLQTKPVHHGSGIRSRNSFAGSDPKSPTAFNTLSNVYVTAIERSTPTQSTPVTAIKLRQPLKLQTDPDTLRSHQQKAQTPSTALPDTPLSANPTSPACQMEVVYPSTMTPTPPLSAGSVDPGHMMFTFPSMNMNREIGDLPPTPTRRRVSYGGIAPVIKAPYSHNKSLHSILRNSPLQPATAKSPSSPKRKSVRLQERAARRVGYESPLTRTITTEKYTRSHIDLLAEEASPYTPSPMPEDLDVDLAMAYSGDEQKDGGLTPGPFEEMRRRMTGLATETPVLSPKPEGVRKRRRKEKKRKWVWTIGKEDDESESAAIAAIPTTVEEASTPTANIATVTEPVSVAEANTQAPPTPSQGSAETAISGSNLAVEKDADRMDIDALEADSSQSNLVTTNPCINPDPAIPSTNQTLASTKSYSATPQQLDGTDLINYETGNRRDALILLGIIDDL